MNQQVNSLVAGESMPRVDPRESSMTPSPTLRAIPPYERTFPALPRPLTTFIGRETETAEITALVRNEARLITLTGPGGSARPGWPYGSPGRSATTFPTEWRLFLSRR